MNGIIVSMQEEVESEEEGGVFMDLSTMKETRDLEVHVHVLRVRVDLETMLPCSCSAAWALQLHVHVRVFCWKYTDFRDATYTYKPHSTYVLPSKYMYM